MQQHPGLFLWYYKVGEIMRDLLFKTEDFIFSYRVAGILEHNGKLFLQKYKDDYTFVGGHVLGLEMHRDALKTRF